MRPRRAAVEDAVEIAAIEAAAAQTPWSATAIRSALGQPATLAFVVGHPVCGHLLATAVADEGEILSVAVHPDQRRRGLGGALLAACEEAWRAAGVRQAWLEVRVGNVAAIALYRSRGWVDAGVRARYYADGTDAARMRWEVP